MTRFESALMRVPGLLASRSHQLFLIVLGLWLIAVPLIPGLDAYAPSTFAEMVGGNWTNVASALGSSIAAGYAVKVHADQQQHHSVIREFIASAVQEIARTQSDGNPRPATAESNPGPPYPATAQDLTGSSWPTFYRGQ